MSSFGEQSEAEFWINKPGFFIYIVYIAVRDDHGNFRGVMEMMQDCTHIRQLEGEQRLLSWGTDSASGNGARHGTETETYTAGSDRNVTTNSNREKVILSGDTKLKPLLQQFPGMKEDLIAYDPKFSILNSPMAKVILPMATLKMMSEQSGIPRQELMEKINELITVK